jgi:DNA-binding transcriptional MerR regulator
MGQMRYKVGELARRTGLTVRTLHHYDAIGLLKPSERAKSGHRLYGVGDVARLQQIRSLRMIGLGLDEIGSVLDRTAADPSSAIAILERQLAHLRHRIELEQRLQTRLESLVRHLHASGQLSPDDLLHTIEEMTMFEKYYTPEQLEQLAERRRMLGDDHLRAVEAEWPQLMAAVRAEMAKGTDPSDERVQKLARRWRELIEEFTDGDPGIARSLAALYRGEPAVAGMDSGEIGGMNRYLFGKRS